MNIKYLKLVTGEELITQYVDEGESTVTMKNPLGILMSQTEKGFNIQLVPYGSMADKETIVVNQRSIVFTAEPETKLRNQYESITGQVITPPTPQIVT